MKLGSLKAGGRDGTLIVVDRQLSRYVTVPEIALNLAGGVGSMGRCSPPPQCSIFHSSTGVKRNDVQAMDFSALASPLPRAYEFVDGSAYLPHVERVRKARGAEVPESFYTDPLMYQATAAGFLGPRDDIPVVSEGLRDRF